MALELTNITPSAASTKARSARAGGVQISAKERLFFTEQLALLLDTGTNLHSALLTLSRQTRTGKLQTLLNDAADHVSGGRTFSEALERHPASFAVTFTNLVRAGENGGFLPRVLEQLKNMEESRDKLRSDVMSALSYPLFLLMFSGGVVVFVLLAVFPKFEDMFAAIADELPPTTKVLMAVSHVLRTNSIVVLLFMAATCAAVFFWFRSENGRYWVDRAALQLPILRSIFVPLYLVQSLRVMSLSLSNGVGIIDALKACREVVSNKLYTAFILSLETTVNDGAGIAIGFRRASFMPDIVKEMIATGEETGCLPKVMERVAAYYETDLEKRLAMVARMAEPVMLVIMGLVVGIIVSSLILPIFQLSRAVH